MADSKISALPAASALTGTESIPAIQSLGNVALTPAQIVAYHEGLSSLAELIRDTIGATLVAGTNVVLTVDDPGNTITIAASGGGSGGAGTTTNPLTMNSSGSGAASGTTFDGSLPRTISWNTIGASPALHPGYVSGNWYHLISAGTVAGGSSNLAGHIKLLPFSLPQPITINALGVKVITAQVGSNCQAAIYANNAATGRPTGAALVSTGNMSAAAAGTVSAAVTSTTLQPGTYWMAVNVDTTGVVFQTLSLASLIGDFIIGSATLANIASSNSTALLNLDVTQAFGVWPDLTSATFTESTGNNSGLVFAQAA